MLTLAAIVDTKELWQTVAAAAVAGIGVTLVFSLAILGAARSADATRDGKRAEAVMFGVLATLGLLGTAAAVTIGMIVMTAK
jgi:hypothetical protein